MHRLIPHMILENYAAGRIRGAFPAVGMFADMSGFSTMTDELMTHGQHGAEVLAMVLREAFGPMIQNVYEQGGFIATQAGDAFTAVFPIQENPEATAQRALTAALRMQEHIQDQSRPVTPYGEFSIAVKIGLTLGEASWGVLTSRDEQQAVCYFKGSAIDGSAQAEHFAQREQIILAPAFYTIVQDSVQTETVQSHYRLRDYHGELAEPIAFQLPDPDLELSSRFFPKDLLLQSYAGEFRQVVGLFVGLADAPSDAQLQQFMHTVFELQQHYGGLAKLYFGDKGPHVLLIWGAPVTYENDVERALSFFLDLQASTASQLHAGMTYRIAHAGCIGSVLSEEYATFGRGVNLAARFMTSAPAGEIWVDETVAKRAAKNFNILYVDARNFKGFAQPQKVFMVSGRKEARELDYTGQLVGREKELEQLQAFVQSMFSGAYAGLMVVYGEPGMGKSRLVYEFLDQVTEQHADSSPTWFLAQTDQLLRESLNPFRYWLKLYFGLSDLAGEMRNKSSFDKTLDELIGATHEKRLAEELDRTRPFLGAMLGLRWPGSLYEQLDAEGRFQNTLIGLTTLIQAESLRQPVIFFLEDAQWLDNDSADYLPRLLRALTADESIQYPVALIATSRYEGLKLPLDTLPHRQIDLGRLDRAALATLAQSQLGGAASQGLLDLLEARAEGNPFFAEQILHYAQEEGLLSEKDGHWTYHQAEDRPALPADVNAILVARLDQLVQEVKETVQTAAVLGREFELRVLARLLERQEMRSDDFPGLIGAAEDQAIWAALSNIRYIFRHALMWDAAYSMQIHARRQALHTVVVEALESLYADDLGSRYSELAYHAERAMLTEKARTYLFQAAEAAKSAYQNSQAEDYYTRALQLTPETDLAGQFDLLLARVEIYQIQGRHEERQRDLQTLEALAQALNDPLRNLEIIFRKADAIFDKGDSHQAEPLARQAIEMALALGNTATAMASYNRLANAMLRLGQFDAATQNIEKGLELARNSGDRLMECKLLNTFGLIAMEQRNVAKATECFKQGLALARQIGELRMQAQPLANLGMAAIVQGNYLTGQNYYEQALELARKIGVRYGEAVVLGNLGFIAGNLGDYLRARSYAEAHLRIAREIGNQFDETYGLINLSSHVAALGDYETAMRYAEDGLKLARQIGEQSGTAWALTYLGHSQLAAGKTRAAADSYGMAAQIRKDLNQPLLATEPLAGQARTALTLGDTSAARQHVDEILAFLEKNSHLNGTDDPLRVYLSCYLVMQATNDARARSMLETAHTLLQARASEIPDETNRRAFLEKNENNRLILAAWQAN